MWSIVRLEKFLNGVRVLPKRLRISHDSAYSDSNAPLNFICTHSNFHRKDFLGKINESSDAPLTKVEIRATFSSGSSPRIKSLSSVRLGVISGNTAKSSEGVVRYYSEIWNFYNPGGPWDGVNSVYLKLYVASESTGCFLGDAEFQDSLAPAIISIPVYEHPIKPNSEGEPTNECYSQLTTDPKSAETASYLSCLHAAIPKSPKYIELVKKLEKLLAEDLKLPGTKLEFVPTK